MSLSAGVNGFGRFGSHLIRYWILNRHTAAFTINYINDEQLTLDQAIKIVNNDPHLDLQLSKIDNQTVLVKLGRDQAQFTFTNHPLESLSWRSQVNLFLECSGRYTQYEGWRDLFTKHTKHVLVSATSQTADQTLIYGYNHTEYTPSAYVISYGSCTVNAYVPLANFIHEQYGVLSSDVNVIHNVPAHQLLDYREPLRKSCTLEQSGPKLLPFINDTNFTVNYTLVPYTGVSLIDFRFQLRTPPASAQQATNELLSSINNGSLTSLYSFAQPGDQPSDHKFTVFSAVIQSGGVKLIGDSLYLSAFFDNENSVNRYFDLTNYIAQETQE